MSPGSKFREKLDVGRKHPTTSLRRHRNKVDTLGRWGDGHRERRAQKYKVIEKTTEKPAAPIYPRTTNC